MIVGKRGWKVGTNVGERVGLLLGTMVGENGRDVGFRLGTRVGTITGIADGSFEGLLVGWIGAADLDGWEVGIREGCNDGFRVDGLWVGLETGWPAKYKVNWFSVLNI